MSGTKNKNTKKSKINPEWIDEKQPEEQGSTRLTVEQEAKLFHDAIEFGRIPQKDIAVESRTKNPTKSKKSNERHDIDLHGLTVEEAQRHVVRAIEDILTNAKGQIVNIRVITGKGHHSPNKRPQLLHSIHHIVEDRFKSRLISIDASPHLLKIGDSYLKGHFDLKIR
jgi:DNA-nicking Smr family endonuclease